MRSAGCFVGPAAPRPLLGQGQSAGRSLHLSSTSSNRFLPLSSASVRMPPSNAPATSILRARMAVYASTTRWIVECARPPRFVHHLRGLDLRTPGALATSLVRKPQSRGHTLRKFRVKDWTCCLLAASLPIAYGCAEPKSAPQSPETEPIEAHHDETDLPPPSPGPEEATPPDTGAPPPGTAPMQPAEEPRPDPFKGQQTGSVSQSEVEQFAEIQIALVTLQQQIAEEAQAGASQAQLQQIHAQLAQKAEQIVEASPLSRQRFEEITSLAQRDPYLRRRVQAAIDGSTKGN